MHTTIIDEKAIELAESDLTEESVQRILDYFEALRNDARLSDADRERFIRALRQQLKTFEETT